MIDQFSRTRMLIGANGIEKLSHSCVVVFGIGGVGSAAVEALARAGVGKIIIVDNDTVSLTNLNRQIIATHSSIGRPKVEVMKERVLDINPSVEIIACKRFYLSGDPDNIICDKCDYIIDAIDTVTGKIGLIMEGAAKGIPIISSMGTGNKIDPTMLEITDIYKTTICPLAKVMRKELRERGIKSLKVLYSKEIPIKTSENECDFTDECSGFIKKRTPGSISFVPPVAGMIIAGEVIKDLLGLTCKY